MEHLLASSASEGDGLRPYGAGARAGRAGGSSSRPPSHLLPPRPQLFFQAQRLPAPPGSPHPISSGPAPHHTESAVCRVCRALPRNPKQGAGADGLMAAHPLGGAGCGVWGSVQVVAARKGVGLRDPGLLGAIEEAGGAAAWGPPFHPLVPRLCLPRVRRCRHQAKALFRDLTSRAAEVRARPLGRTLCQQKRWPLRQRNSAARRRLSSRSVCPASHRVLFHLFCFEAILGDANGLLLAPCSGMLPGGAQGSTRNCLLRAVLLLQPSGASLLQFQHLMVVPERALHRGPVWQTPRQRG